MLSLTLMSAIAAVALPHYRITPLSALRTVALVFIGTAALVMLDVLWSRVGVGLFSSSMVFDLQGTSGAALVLLTAALSMCFWGVRTTGSETPLVLPLLLLFTMMGTLYLATASDLITLAISLELQSFAVYAIASAYRWRDGATSAGLLYFLLGGLSSGILLLGATILFAYTGETSMAGLQAVLTEGGADPAVLVGAALLTVGLLFKVTAAPFHNWGPDVYDSVPTTITAWLAVLPKYAVLMLLVRIPAFTDSPMWESLVLISALASFGFGSLVGLAQSRIKRLLAYSTVSHVGFMLVASCAGATLGLGAFGFYLAQYGLTSLLPLLALLAVGYGIVMPATGTAGTANPVGTGTATGASTAGGNYPDIELISGLSGLWLRGALLAMAIGVGIYSAAGVPPMIGFFAKLSVLQGAVWRDQWIVAGVSLLSSVASAGFYLSVVVTMYFGSATPNSAAGTSSH